MSTPYNTGKVRIGCAYQPPVKRYQLSRTEEKLQTALLGSKPCATDWDGIAIVVGCAALIAAPYLVFAWSAA